MTEQPEPTFGAREAQPLDGMMQQALGEGWEFFKDKLETQSRASTLELEKDRGLQRDAYLLFQTEQGRRVLEWLADITVRRPMWFMGVPDPLTYCAMREGQNGVLFTLLKLIAAGRDEKPPQREGT